MDKLAFADWQTFAIVALVLLELFNLIVKTAQNYRAEKARKNAPVTTLEDRMKAYDVALEEINRKIERLERKDNERVSESRLILRGLLALTRHGVDGNNIQGLKDYRDELQSYLVDK